MNPCILSLKYSSALFSLFTCALSSALIFISFPLILSYCRCMQQQAKQYSMSKNRSELSYPHREHVSGNLGFPHKQSEDVKEMENNLSGHFYKRPSHSGPLAPGSGWARGVNEVDNGPPVSTRVNLSKLSGLVASRTLLSEDQQQKPVSLLHRKPIEVRKSVEASNGSESRRRRDKKRIVDQSQIVNRRVPTEKSTPVRYYCCCYLYYILYCRVHWVLLSNWISMLNSISGWTRVKWKQDIPVWSITSFIKQYGPDAQRPRS